MCSETRCGRKHPQPGSLSGAQSKGPRVQGHLFLSPLQHDPDLVPNSPGLCFKMPQTRPAALVRFGTTGFIYSYNNRSRWSRVSEPVGQGHRKKQQPQKDSGCQAGSPGRAWPLGDAERRPPPSRPEGPAAPRASLPGAQPLPQAAVTQHLAGSGRGGGVACSRTGAPRHRGLRPASHAPRSGPCLLLEVDGPLHRTVALQHAHRFHRHASPGDTRRPPEGPGRARREGDNRRHRRKGRKKMRPRRRGAFIRLCLATPTLARNQSLPAASARPPALRGAPWPRGTLRAGPRVARAPGACGLRKFPRGARAGKVAIVF